MRYITDIIKYFTFITTGIVILFIVIMLKNGNDGLYLSTLIKMPCAGLVTSVVTVFLYPSEVHSKKGYLLRVLLHYVTLCIVMITMGLLFDWISFNISEILGMTVSVALIYAFTFTVSYITSKNDADEMNRILKNKNNNS